LAGKKSDLFGFAVSYIAWA